MTRSPWRDPPADTPDLYPGLGVHDDRATGAICLSGTRTALWSWIYQATVFGWESVDHDFELSEDGWTAHYHALFLSHLLDVRGEFGRLLLVLADAERCDQRGPGRRAWWETRRHRKRVGDQLRRCLAVLDDEGDS